MGDKGVPCVFLSTPPSRVATRCRRPGTVRIRCFYPRHPRGWRPVSDILSGKTERFYPRHPRGWRRCWIFWRHCSWGVSIHATLAGGDIVREALADFLVGFLSTLPSRVATSAVPRHATQLMFLSTPPSRVATFTMLSVRRSMTLFLSTPPSRVATQPWSFCGFPPERFYPRHPRGWRLSCRRAAPQSLCVSIHATLAGGDS